MSQIGKLFLVLLLLGQIIGEKGKEKERTAFNHPEHIKPSLSWNTRSAWWPQSPCREPGPDLLPGKCFQPCWSCSPLNPRATLSCSSALEHRACSSLSVTITPGTARESKTPLSFQPSPSSAQSLPAGRIFVTLSMGAGEAGQGGS